MLDWKISESISYIQLTAILLELEDKPEARTTNSIGGGVGLCVLVLVGNTQKHAAAGAFSNIIITQ